MIREYLHLCNNCHSYLIPFNYDTDKIGTDTCIMVTCPYCHKLQQATVGIIENFIDYPLSLRWRLHNGEHCRN